MHQLVNKQIFENIKMLYGTNEKINEYIPWNPILEHTVPVLFSEFVWPSSTCVQKKKRNKQNWGCVHFAVDIHLFWGGTQTCNILLEKNKQNNFTNK